MCEGGVRGGEREGSKIGERERGEREEREGGLRVGSKSGEREVRVRSESGKSEGCSESWQRGKGVRLVSEREE